MNLNLNYAHPAHRELPHIIKFSGGRSSGLLLMQLLDHDLLNPARGDCIIFNNTSAEHPATYRFVAEATRQAEAAGMPLFWLEYQTCERHLREARQRAETYRLVQPTPWAPDNPDGYHHQGEIFEETLSKRRLLPNKFKRHCTHLMKVWPTELFMADWLGGIRELPDQGEPVANMTLDEAEAVHRRHGGQQESEKFRSMTKYLLGRPPRRPRQQMQDYTRARLHPPPAPPENGDYLSILGIRADEPARAARMRERHRQADENYQILMPLTDWQIDRAAVRKYWQRQNWNLQLPEELNLSNCVFCPMKATSRLVQIARLQTGRETGPAGIEWWQEMERKYNRARPGQSSVSGFFAYEPGLTYQTIQAAAEREKQQPELIPITAADLPCDCTD